MTAFVSWITRRRSARQTGGRPAQDDVVLAENVYGKYAIPAGSAHRTAARKVIEGSIYEPRTIELMRAECGAGDIVHAGTFFGDFLPALSSGLAPGALVHAFEPSPENHACAQRTLELNGIDNVVLACLGLGAEPGRDDLLTVGLNGEPRGGSSRLVRPDDELEGRVTVEVPIDTIDARVPADRTVSVLQLDVEGHEQAALTGALGTIERCRPLIIVESVPDDDWLEKHLVPLGYRATERVHHNTVFRA
ncbi:MAG TPA: FkbM family methyltransferase [Nocardioides sp.]|nr:FkbM family methyltransferase [Nocardioides sp.]